jgi:phosphate butyryltransferase
MALEAVVRAKRNGIAEAILIGDTEEIAALLDEMGETVFDYETVSCHDEREAAALAVRLVKEGKADIPMKGLMMTSSFMHAVLDKEAGLLNEGELLSQATVLEFSEEHRMLVISDCAVNIEPDYEQKIRITKNAVGLAHLLGIEKPQIAFLSALEKVNPKIPSTVEMSRLAAFVMEGGIPGAGAAAGPLALDVAVSAEAAIHKGVDDPVCGAADILIVPDLVSGNIFTKSLTFFAHLRSAGTIAGTERAVVMTSRTDTPEDKYLSVLVAILQATRNV